MIELAERQVAGLGTRFVSILSPDRTSKKAIPELWHVFINQFLPVARAPRCTSYGLVEMLPESEQSHPAEMYYVACAAVEDFREVPAGMIRRLIPAGKYARFTHTGALDRLEETMASIAARGRNSRTCGCARDRTLRCMMSGSTGNRRGRRSIFCCP
jgi:predicted transcriptional regulator YdeE